ncbi:hypothetical protein [Streptomyces fuscigenes]|uniref:hypothetical protein n=1 Tax=Streptomyces fuscigenes TaxID=1528880 RepID=UPI001F3828E5|nr:hypothetical protein [Streptomyces fuscigenes]MCF3965048.1 hypothetical protein [Streptomyces fuscigenes]
MKRVLGIELRRSAAPAAALLIAAAGAIVLHATPGRWSAGWMALVTVQREYLAVLSPLATAAGAWQSYREHRADVAELFAAAPLPRARRVVPTLAATALAAVAAYLAALLAAAPRIASTARYLPPAAFAVVAVGLVAMVASIWLGLAVGRLVPALATAPALAVVDYALLLFAPHALPDGGETAAFSPMGASLFSDYDTVGGGVSAAQALWTAALAAAAVVLFAVRRRRNALAALLPVAAGAVAAALVVPTGAAYARSTLDPAAQRLVCTPDAPRVCVSRAHEGLLPEVVPRARHALSLLAGTPVVQAHEDTTTFSPPTAPRPRADTALLRITVGRDGRLAHPESLEPSLLTDVFTGPGHCGDARDFEAATAAAYWLLDREPAAGPDGTGAPDPGAVALWKGLHALPRAEAHVRVIALYRAAHKCAPTSGQLTGGGR